MLYFRLRRRSLCAPETVYTAAHCSTAINAKNVMPISLISRKPGNFVSARLTSSAAWFFTIRSRLVLLLHARLTRTLQAHRCSMGKSPNLAMAPRIASIPLRFLIAVLDSLFKDRLINAKQAYCAIERQTRQ